MTRWAEVLTEQNPVQAAAGKDVSFSYDADGNLLTVTDAKGNTVTYRYNARNEEVSMTDPMDQTTSYGYDADGNLITVTDPMDQRHVTYSYNAENELLTVTDPLHETMTYGYDLDGEVTSVTDAKGFKTTYSYNNLGLLFGRVGETEVDQGELTYCRGAGRDLHRMTTTATWSPRPTATGIPRLTHTTT